MALGGMGPVECDVRAERREDRRATFANKSNGATELGLQVIFCSTINKTALTLPHRDNDYYQPLIFCLVYKAVTHTFQLDLVTVRHAGELPPFLECGRFEFKAIGHRGSPRSRPRLGVPARAVRGLCHLDVR